MHISLLGLSCKSISKIRGMSCYEFLSIVSWDNKICKVLKWCLGYCVWSQNSISKVGKGFAQVNRLCACICTFKYYWFRKTRHYTVACKIYCMLLALPTCRMFVGRHFETLEERLTNQREICLSIMWYRVELKRTFYTSRHLKDNIGQVSWS